MKQKTIVAGAFLIRDNKVLLALRQNTTCDNGYYCVIGGKIEHDEAIHAGLIREINEESGLIVRSEDMHLMHVMSFKKEDSKEFVSFDFIVTHWEGDPVNREAHKHAALDWFSLDNLPPNFIERHKIAYELYKQGTYYSSYNY